MVYAANVSFCLPLSRQNEAEMLSLLPGNSIFLHDLLGMEWDTEKFQLYCIHVCTQQCEPNRILNRRSHTLPADVYFALSYHTILHSTSSMDTLLKSSVNSNALYKRKFYKILRPIAPTFSNRILDNHYTISICL